MINHLREEIKVNEEVLYTFKFSLTQFAKQIGLYPLNSYQRTKLLKLQGLPPIYRWFSDSEFRSSIVFPIIRVTNQTSSYFLMTPNLSTKAATIVIAVSQR